MNNVINICIYFLPNENKCKTTTFYTQNFKNFAQKLSKGRKNQNVKGQ